METILQISLSWLILACILQSLLLYIPTVAGYSNDTILLKYVPASKTFIQSHGLMHIPVKRTRTNLEISPLGSNRKIGRLKKQELKISQTSAAELKCRYRNILYKLFSTKNLPVRSMKYNCYDIVSNTRQPIDGYSQQLHLGRFKRSANSLRTQANKRAKRKSAKEQNVSSNNTLSTNDSLPNTNLKITKPTKTAASSSHNPRRKTKKQTETATSSNRNRRRKTTRPTIAAASYVRKPRSKIIQPTAAASLIYNPRSKVIKPTTATSLIHNSRSKNIKPTAAASFVHNPPDKITPTPATSFIKTTMITDVDTKSIPYKTHQPTSFSSLPKIVSSSVPLPRSSITASKSEAILLSSSHKTASTSLFVQSTSSASQIKPSMALVTPIYNSLPLNTFTTSTNIHPVTSSKFEPSGLTSHLLHSGSEGPLMTKIPTPFITLQLKNDSTDTNTQPKIENSLYLTPTYASTNRRSKKNVSLLSNQLRTASLSTSNIVLLLNNSLLATLDTKQSSLAVQTTKVPNPNLSSKTLKLDSSTKTLSSNNSRPQTKPVIEETTVVSKSPLSPTNSLYKSFTLHPNTISSSQLYTLLQPTPNTGSNSTNFSQTFPSSKYKFVVSTNGASVESKATASPTADWTKSTLETKSSTFTTTIATIFKPLITSTSDPSPTNVSVKGRKDAQNSYIIVPDWKVAKQEWKAAWHVHIYTFGSLFALLAIYLLICLLRLRQTIHLLNNYYFVAVNLLLFTFCLLRALFLLVDGYNSDHTYHYLIGFLLFYLAFPCLTSAFALIFYAFLKTAKVYYLSSKFQCLPLLITIIVVHFLLPITAAILIGLFLTVKIFLFVCQIFFVLWGLFLFLGYIYVYKKLHFAAEKRQKLLLQLREAKIHMDNYTIYKERLTLCLGVTVALFSSIIGTFCTCLQVYSALYFLGIFPNELPRPWPWWGYQTAVRFFEFLFCIITTYISTLPFKHRSKYGCDPWFYCSSYTWLCRKENMWNSHKDISWTNMDENISSIGISKDTRRKEIKAAGYEIIPLTISLSQESENLALDEPDSMLIVQNGFVRFRTDEELEELRQSPRVPRMHAVAPVPVSIPKVPKTLQWSNSNSSKCHQNNGFQSKDALLGSGSSPECLSSSTSPSSSQFNRVSTAGSELTFKAPSLSLASSIDKELEHFFRHSSHRSLSSVTSADVLAINEDTSSENSVFQADDNADGIETGDDHSKRIPSFFLTEDPDDSLNMTPRSRKDNLNLTSYSFHNSNPQITNV